MRAVPALAVAIALALAACADFPEIDASGRDLGPAGRPPPLLPFDALVGATAAPPPNPFATRSLDARVAALRARAAILRRPLSDPGDIDAMRARLARLR